VRRPRVPDAARAIDKIHVITENIRHCEDLSELLMFVAEMAASREATVLLADPETCARVWRGVAGVQAQIYETLTDAHLAAAQLHDATLEIAKNGVR
jgi:hypothetical protein